MNCEVRQLKSIVVFHKHRLVPRLICVPLFFFWNIRNANRGVRGCLHCEARWPIEICQVMSQSIVMGWAMARTCLNHGSTQQAIGSLRLIGADWAVGHCTQCLSPTGPYGQSDGCPLAHLYILNLLDALGLQEANVFILCSTVHSH